VHDLHVCEHLVIHSSTFDTTDLYDLSGMTGAVEASGMTGASVGCKPSW